MGKVTDVHAEEVAKTQKLLYFVNIGRVQCVLYGLEFVNSGKNASLGQSEPKVGDFFEFTFGQVNLYPILEDVRKDRSGPCPRRECGCRRRSSFRSLPDM